MAYAQINYQEHVGNSNLTLAEIGCFVTADCNLAADYGLNIDPATLNTFYEQTGAYTYDLTDHANDDITWNTITRKFPNIVCTQVHNSPGWPQSNQAIVKFIYKAHTGATITHFCKVADFTKQLIVDSYDGKVKSPGIYGQPVAYATFANTAAPAPSPAPAAPAAAPVAPPAPAQPQQLFLPSAAGTWRVYNVGGPWIVGHEIHKLAPINYPPGLTYDILATLAPHVFEIQTTMFGRVAIYAGPDTIAQFPGGGHGSGEANASSYAALDNPIALTTNKQAPVYDYTNDQETAYMESGEPFTAVGKAIGPNGTVYFVHDSTSKLGIKTVDLTAVEAPTAAAAVSSDDDAGEKVPVKVSKWQDTYTRFVGGPRRFVVNSDVEVNDIDDDGPDDLNLPQELKKGWVLWAAGKFSRDGVVYYRTTKSEEAYPPKWYGIDPTCLTKASTDEELDQLIADIKKENDAAAKNDGKIAKVATSQGMISRLFNKNKGVK